MNKYMLETKNKVCQPLNNETILINKNTISYLLYGDKDINEINSMCDVLSDKPGDIGKRISEGRNDLEFLLNPLFKALIL